MIITGPLLDILPAPGKKFASGHIGVADRSFFEPRFLPVLLRALLLPVEPTAGLLRSVTELVAQLDPGRMILVSEISMATSRPKLNNLFPLTTA
jgi:hypothetical protein